MKRPTDDDVQKLATAVDDLEVPTDNTLDYDADRNLKVNVQDVIEHLQERIRYYTSANTYGDAGASVGQVYATSQYRKLITKVEVLFDPLVGADAFLVRLVELNADNSIKTKLFTSNTRSAPFGAGGAVRAFTFHDADGDPGVRIGKGIRLGILLSRTGDNSDSSVEAIHGSEASGSPNETYDDASADFELVNDVVYNHIDPAVGASTHSHGTDIRGNIKIFYTNIIDHGNFVASGGGVTEPPTVYIWGANQTVRLPIQSAEIGTTQIVGTTGVRAWNRTLETLHGGDDIGIAFSNINNETDADSAAQVDVDDTVIEFEDAGTYSLKMKFVGNQAQDADATTRLKKIMSGADDAEFFVYAGRTKGPPTEGTLSGSITALHEGEEENITIAAGDKVYLQLVDHAGPGQALLAGYIQIKKVA